MSPKPYLSAEVAEVNGGHNGQRLQSLLGSPNVAVAENRSEGLGFKVLWAQGLRRL